MKRILLFLSLLLLFPICLNVDAKTLVISDFLKEKSLNDPFMIDDKTVDNNIRYVGKNPNNYVYFNDELWRIVGVFNNIHDYDARSKRLVKLIKVDSIGDYSWDTSLTNVNNGTGVNDWSNSDIMNLLNNKYYVGLSENSKQLIEKVSWNTQNKGSSNYNKASALDFYKYENSDSVDKLCESTSVFCNDDVDRNTSWIGYVGLIYASDYAYATSGGNNIDRETCSLRTQINSWKVDSVNSNIDPFNECYSNNYLREDNYQWTMSSVNTSTYNSTVFGVKTGIDIRYASDSYMVRPVVYLKDNIYISDGDGSLYNPYKLSIIEVKEKTINVNDMTTNFKELFPDVEFEDVTNYRILGDPIVDVKSDIIVPTGTGITTIVASVNNVDYAVDLNITNLPVKNPNTNSSIKKVINIFVGMIISILFVLCSHRIVKNK